MGFYKVLGVCFVLQLLIQGWTEGLKAQSYDSTGYEETSTDLLHTSLSGFAEMDHISYLGRNTNSGYSRNQGMLHLNLDSRAGSKARLYSSVEIREDLSNRDRSRVFLQEAYVDVFLKKFDLRLGKQIVTWGAADGINYTSNINSYNFTDLLDLRYQTVGVFALKADYYLKGWTFTGVAVPVFTPSLLPAQHSAWGTVLPEVLPNPADPAGAFRASYQFADPVLPSKDISAVQYAVKAATTLGKIDISLSYYNGYNDLPVQFLQYATPVSADSVHVLIQPEYRPWEVIGADFSSVLGKFGVRGEGAYFITDDRQRLNDFRNKPYFQYVLGIDRRWDKLYLLFQWLHEFTSEEQKFSYQDLNHVFQQSLMARVECSVGDYAQLAVKGVYNIAAEDYYLRPELNYDITGGLKLTVLADILDGPKNGFFGQYRNNDRVQVRMKYSF